MDTNKDIEILEEFKENGFASLMIKYNKNRIQTNTMVKRAIENVLSDREFLQDKVNWYSKEYDKLFDENNKLSNELETWKKIAEKLAEHIDNYSYKGGDEFYNVDYGCDFQLRTKCVCDDNKGCEQCIIDWAKREVENEKNNSNT